MSNSTRVVPGEADVAIESVWDVPAPIDGDTGAGVRAAALGRVDVVTLFQPIVSLDTENVVGYEALSRWPSASGVSPERVFAYAKSAGVLAELDRRCIRSAAVSAVTAGLLRGALLLINTEPGTADVVSATDDSLTDARVDYRVVFELTERDLLAHPGPLLAKVAALRAAGFGIALDDVGGDPDVLAWLEVIDPDLIKLDLSLIQRRPAPEQARVLNAVYGHHERRGAMIVAEGIETEAHLEQARAVGATLGQGYRFGAPTPATRVAPTAGSDLPALGGCRRRPAGAIAAPFDVVRDHASVRVARKHLLAAFSRDIEAQAEQASDRPMVLAAVQHGDHLPTGVRARYRRLTRKCALVAVFGHDLPENLGAGVVGVGLDAEDRLCGEWTLIILGSHTASALIAREHRDPTVTCDEDRRFEFVITTDRTLVAAAAANLLSRVP